MKPAHSTKDWPLCLPQNGITPTAAHYAGCAVVWPSPFYTPLSSPSEGLDHHVDMPSRPPQRSTLSISNQTSHQGFNSRTHKLFFPVISIFICI